VLRPDTNYRGDGTEGAATITIADNDNKVTAGLVAYYPLDEHPASQHEPALSDDPDRIIVHDPVGGHDGAFIVHQSGSGIPIPRWLPGEGKLGGALWFYDAPSRVLLPGSLVAGTDFSLTLWVRTRQSDSTFVSSRLAARPICSLNAGRFN